jgi:hypothetical protein
MRKGLVTLGVVALVLAVSPGFAEAPLLTCLPDIVISDVEQNSATADANLFVFSDAINLDEYVVDPDTPVDTLRWSFMESASGQTIEINGILSDPLLNTVEPGANDLRAVDQMASFADAEWNATPPTTAGETKQAMIDMFVSDGTAVATQTLMVTTVNDIDGTGAGDEAVPTPVASFDFASGAEGWTQFTDASVIVATLAASGGSLNATEPATHDNIVYGAWESPKEPGVGVAPKVGCILAARYQVSTDAASATSTPGFRFRALARPMVQVDGVWDPEFTNDNYNVLDSVLYSSYDLFMNQGGLDDRMPGTGTEYTLMAFPRQAPEQLLDPSVVYYFSADLVDLEGSFDSDSGTLSFESVTIEGLDRPEPGVGTAVTDLTFATADFGSGWTAATKELGTGTFVSTGLSASATASGLEITVGNSSEHFEAYAEMDAGVALEPGRVYRLMFMATSTETPGGDAGPLLRTNMTSTRFVYTAVKELEGGALLARLTSTPSPMEVWIVAPAADTNRTDGLTEPIRPQIQSYLTANVAAWPLFREVSGTVAITEINTEVFDLVNGRLE